MSNWLRNILIALGILALMIITGFVVNYFKERQLIKENTLRIESEMRFKQKVIEAEELTKQLDTAKTIISQKQTLIDYLENNPQIIIRNNEQAHISIDKLNAYNSIVRFTDNVAKYENNRQRYSLYRFDKHN